MACTSDPEHNFQTATQYIRDAAKQEAQIICLPELFLSNYFCQTENPKNFSLAEPIPGPTSNTFAQLAKELEIVLIIPLFEKRTEGRIFGISVMFGGEDFFSPKRPILTILPYFQKNPAPSSVGYIKCSGCQKTGNDLNFTKKK